MLIFIIIPLAIGIMAVGAGYYIEATIHVRKEHEAERKRRELERDLDIEDLIN